MIQKKIKKILQKCLYFIRRVSQSLIFPSLCTAVHVIISFPVSFSLLCFLVLFIAIPKAGWDAKKQIEKEEKRELHELPSTKIVKSETIRLFPLNCLLRIAALLQHCTLYSTSGLYMHLAELGQLIILSTSAIC